MLWAVYMSANPALTFGVFYCLQEVWRNRSQAVGHRDFSHTDWWVEGGAEETKEGRG